MKINNIERYVLEELRSKSQTLEQLTRNTKIKKQILINVLQRLIIKGFVRNRKEEYTLLADKLDQVKYKSNDLARELNPTIKNLLLNGLNNKENSLFKMKRFKFTTTNQAIFNNLLDQLDKFIDENNIADKTPIREHQLFFGLSGNYIEGVNP